MQSKSCFSAGVHGNVSMEIVDKIQVCKDEKTAN